MRGGESESIGNEYGFENEYAREYEYEVSRVCVGMEWNGM